MCHSVHSTTMAGCMYVNVHMCICMYVCTCVCTMHPAYLYLAGGRSRFDIGVGACIRSSVCVACMYAPAHTCVCTERVSGSGGFIIRHCALS